jgi:hypothetical protein
MDTIRYRTSGRFSNHPRKVGKLCELSVGNSIFSILNLSNKKKRIS